MECLLGSISFWCFSGFLGNVRGDAIGAHTLEIGTKTKSLSMVLGVAFFDVEE